VKPGPGKTARRSRTGRGARRRRSGGFSRPVVWHAEHRSSARRCGSRAGGARTGPATRVCDRTPSPECITRGRAGASSSRRSVSSTTFGVARSSTDDGELCRRRGRDAPARSRYSTALPGRGHRAARGGPRSLVCRWATCTRGEWSSRLGIPGPSVGGPETTIVRPATSRPRRRAAGARLTTCCNLSTAGSPPTSCAEAQGARRTRHRGKRRRSTSRSTDEAVRANLRSGLSR